MINSIHHPTSAIIIILQPEDDQDANGDHGTSCCLETEQFWKYLVLAIMHFDLKSFLFSYIICIDNIVQGSQNKLGVYCM